MTKTETPEPTRDDNPLRTSDGGAKPVVAAEPETTFDERTTGITHPWQVGTDADARKGGNDTTELVGAQITGDGKTEDQMVGTPVGGEDKQPEGHENPAPVNPDPAGVGVEAKGVSEADRSKAQADANKENRAKLDADEETARAKNAEKNAEKSADKK